jgi:hypothetical protein
MPPLLPKEKKGHRPGPKACFQAHRAKRATRGRSSPPLRKGGRTRGSEEWLGGNGAAVWYSRGLTLGERRYYRADRFVSGIVGSDCSLDDTTSVSYVVVNVTLLGEFAGGDFQWVEGCLLMWLTKPSSASLSGAHLHQGSSTDTFIQTTVIQVYVSWDLS